MNSFGWVKLHQFQIIKGGRRCVQFTFHSLRQKYGMLIRACRIFLFVGEGLNLSAGGADNAAQPSRKACFSARQAKLLREPCASSQEGRNAPEIRQDFTARRCKVQTSPSFLNRLRHAHSSVPYFSFYHYILPFVLTFFCSVV